MTNAKRSDVTGRGHLNVLAGALMVLVTNHLARCDGGGIPGTKSPYPVLESRLASGTRFEGEPIYWPDNDRVLIPGYERRLSAVWCGRPHHQGDRLYGGLGDDARNGDTDVLVYGCPCYDCVKESVNACALVLPSPGDHATHGRLTI